MNLIAGFNWLDFLIFFLIIASMTIGFVQGLLRQMIGLAALYIGTILGAQYYPLIGAGIRSLSIQTAVPGKVLNAFSFSVILAFVSSIVNWLAYDAYRSTKLRIAPAIDQLSGTILGLVSIVILMSIVLPVIAFATSEPWPWSEQARAFVATGLQTSRLLTIFDQFRPFLLSTLIPWLPAGVPSLFFYQ